MKNIGCGATTQLFRSKRGRHDYDSASNISLVFRPELPGYFVLVKDEQS